MCAACACQLLLENTWLAKLNGCFKSCLAFKLKYINL